MRHVSFLIPPVNRILRTMSPVALAALAIFASAAAAANEPPVAHSKAAIYRVADLSCQVHLSPADVDDASTDPDLALGDTITLSIDKATLSGVGDHVVTLTVTDSFGAASSSASVVTVAAPATADVNPKRINTASVGQHITVYLEFLTTCIGGPADVDLSTVTLQGIDPTITSQILALGGPTAVGDGNENGVLDRMVTFDRATVQAWFSYDTAVRFQLTGKFTNGTWFVASDALAQVKAKD